MHTRISFSTPSFAVLIPLAVSAALCVHFLNAGVYVSPTGNDTNPGTIDQPFKTLSKGTSALKGNDTVFVRGGTYALSSTISISKAGSDTLRYYIFAYPGERPVFDFSAQTSSDGLKLNGMYWHVYGLEISNAAHNGIAINGSYNTVENCSIHDNRNTGLQLGNGASYNKIINCDSYYNYDPPGGGNADGFAPKLDVGTGNYFYGCRSWQNSDDGWDGYLRPSDSVTTILENCWTFMNGYLKDGNPIATGNGNGFKMGGGDNSNADSLRHNMTLINCLAFDNRVKGFDQNNNRGSMTLLNCTGFRNGTNFQISSKVRATSVVTVKNCISVAANGSGGTASLLSSAIQSTNSWLPPFVVTSDDFIALDTSGMRGPRKPDGSLPDVTFLHLADGSDLIDSGTDIGLPFNGSAPDLGAFESGSAMSVSHSSALLNGFELKQNYPNPFNPSTTIEFSVASQSYTTLRVFNILGQQLAELFSQTAEPNVRYAVRFNAAHLPSGVYFSVLKSGLSIQVMKMVLQK